MNSTPNRASNPAGKPRRKDTTFDFATARNMLPLVKSIVTDIVATQTRLAELAPQQDILDHTRRALDWAGRQKRYAVRDEMSAAENNLAGAVKELDALGLSLSDAAVGRVAFPTRINGKPAAFSWQLGEQGLGFWQYAGEDLRRPIPADWQASEAATARN